MMFSAFSPLISMSDFAHRPGIVVDILAVQQRVGVAIVFQQVFLSDGKHSSGAASWVVDLFDHVSLSKVGLGCQQKVDHQPDHLTGREMISRFFV